MAMESPALAETLLAWPAGHLSIIDRSYTITVYETRSTAILALANAIQSLSQVFCNEANTAACLALLTSEVCLGEPV